MATPALRALRGAHPHASISVEGRPLLRELLLGIPSFDEFLTDPGRGVAALRGRVQQLRQKGFDWAVLLPDSPRAALAPFLARIPLRIGYARDPVRRLLLTAPLEPPRLGERRLPIPMVERYLRVVRALGCRDAGEQLDLTLDPRHVETLHDRLRKLEVRDEQRLLAVTPGASFGSSKLWPPEHFARAADEIARRHALRAVLAPAPSEVEFAARIASLMKTEPLLLAAPAFTLGELKALIARATLLLTNDTGPRHIAVAFERPVVVLMGPTDPRHTATNLERQQVLREPVDCSPCHLKRCPIDHRCMRRLAPERVVEAAATLLS